MISQIIFGSYFVYNRKLLTNYISKTSNEI
jgi:hypothetical protein